MSCVNHCYLRLLLIRDHWTSMYFISSRRGNPGSEVEVKCLTSLLALVDYKPLVEVKPTYDGELGTDVLVMVSTVAWFEGLYSTTTLR